MLKDPSSRLRVAASAAGDVPVLGCVHLALNLDDWAQRVSREGPPNMLTGTDQKYVKKSNIKKLLELQIITAGRPKRDTIADTKCLL